MVPVRCPLPSFTLQQLMRLPHADSRLTARSSTTPSEGTGDERSSTFKRELDQFLDTAFPDSRRRVSCDTLAVMHSENLAGLYLDYSLFWISCDAVEHEEGWTGPGKWQEMMDLAVEGGPREGLSAFGGL